MTKSHHSKFQEAPLSDQVLPGVILIRTMVIFYQHTVRGERGRDRDREHRPVWGRGGCICKPHRPLQEKHPRSCGWRTCGGAESGLALTLWHIRFQVSLPKLISLLCEPSNTSAFVVLSDTATEMALREQALGQPPYLSSFQLRREYGEGSPWGGPRAVRLSQAWEGWARLRPCGHEGSGLCCGEAANCRPEAGRQRVRATAQAQWPSAGMERSLVCKRAAPHTGPLAFAPRFATPEARSGNDQVPQWAHTAS